MNSKEDSTKKLYETVLSSKQDPKCILKALNHILRLAFTDSFHLVFLLDRVPWFEVPYVDFMGVLEKTIRLYRGQGKEATQVGYNILIDGLRQPQVYKPAVNCIYNLAEGRWDWEIILKCLRKNYPHKVCAVNEHSNFLQGLIMLAKKFPEHHVAIVELIMENLVLMDTELLEGDQWISQPFPPDNRIKEYRQKTSQMKQKYDVLMVRMLEYLQQIRSEQFLVKEIFLVFQKKLLLADQTKMIQFILFYVAETNKKTASMFVSLLLGNVLNMNLNTTTQAYINCTFYLSSFIIRSTHLSKNTIVKISNKIIDQLLTRLILLQQPASYQKIYLQKLKADNLRLLYLMQSLLLIMAYFPQVKHCLGETYQKLIKLAHQKLYFEGFVNEEIIKILEIQNNLKGECITFENRFNPVTMTKTGEKIDPVFRQHQYQGPKRKFQQSANKYQGMPCKKIKISAQGSTPISIGSCEESTYKY